MSRSTNLRTAAFAAAWLLATAAAADGPGVLVEIDGLDTGDLEVAGFRLAEAQAVRITAYDLEAHWHPGQLTAAWILDGASRRVVWRMGDAEPTKEDGGLRRYDELLDLPAGTYEAYYATYPDEWEISDDEGWWEGARRVLRRVTERKVLRREDYEDAVDRLRLVVRGRGEELDDDDVEDFHEELRERAVLALAAREDEGYVEGGFVLAQPMEVEVYAVGEADRKHAFDFGWILDARTREKVWKLTFEGSQPAGGSEKNRMARQKLSLPAGKYAAVFVTDGSHSPDEWTVLPPEDPGFWGLTVWARTPPEKSGPAGAWSVEYRDLPEEKAIAALVGLGNDRRESVLISLDEPMAVRVYAVGEGLPSGMADYGWIVDVRNRRKVWVMSYGGTAHAGGDERNRVADEVIHLAAGTYAVGFRTDGAHAYRRWNGVPPSHPERWGISLFAAGDEADPEDVRVGSSDREALAEIVRVRNLGDETASFVLAEPARVLVRAVGEGMHGRMYDYGWIEDAGGRVVWKMSLRQTECAGGASKNRIFHGTLDLDAGRYVVRYKSDDSHAFGSWNEKPPSHPEAWGIRVSAVD